MNEKTNDKTNEFISSDINRLKLIFYTDKPILLHVTLKNGEFRNCFVKGEDTPGVWNIEERKLGPDHLFESEIVRIDKYMSKKSEVCVK